MQADPIRYPVWKMAALGLLLCYPIMAIKWLPFGGGPRYLSVLAGPVSLILLWQMPRAELRAAWLSVWQWSQPFLPYVLAWMFAQWWHGYDPLDANPLTRLFWCTLLFIGARQAGIGYRHLAVAAALGGIAYGVVGGVEVFWLGRERAWGGTYENRFGQYAIWLAALCCLHILVRQPAVRSPVWVAFLILGCVSGVFAAVLSGSRGSLLGLLVLLGIAMAHSMSRRQALLYSVALLIGLSVFVVFYSPALTRFELAYREATDYLNNAAFNPTSMGIRLELFRVAFLMLLDHPLLGPGYTSLKMLYESHPSLGIPSADMLAIPGFHNDWSQSVGIGGGVLLAALVATSIWMGVRARGNVYLQACLGLALVFSVSEIFFSNKLGLTLLMVCWALYSAAEMNKKREQ